MKHWGLGIGDWGLGIGDWVKIIILRYDYEKFRTKKT